jgi:TatA/E family protein of Tat protein translocase
MALIGPLEILLIFFIVLLLIGPKKLPELARALGEAVREFKKASKLETESKKKKLAG